MRITRSLAVAAAAVPLVLGFAGVASADSGYSETVTDVGPHGAFVHTVQSGTGSHAPGFEDGRGLAGFEQRTSGATAQGAAMEHVFSGVDVDGNAVYHRYLAAVGPHGVTFTEVTADSTPGTTPNEG